MARFNVIEDAVFNVLNFLNSSKDIVDFCRTNNISREEFDNYLVILKENRPNLYKEYESRLIEFENMHLEVYKNLISNIINSIKYGIEDENGFRKYQYLDYCLQTNLSLKDFWNYAQKFGLVNLTNVEVIKKFIKENLHSKKFNPTDVLKESYIILINGEVYEVSKMEKLQVLEMMRDLKLPQDIKIYKQLIKRYLEGNFRIDSSTNGK